MNSIGILDHIFTVPLEAYLRIILSMCLGALIGYERTSKGKPAGIRTYSLICVSSTLIMIVSVYGLDYTIQHHDFQDGIQIVHDPTRIGAQVVSGIGFIGAALVYFNQRGHKKGLTSAAQIWSTSIVGLSLGVGMYDVALLTTVCMFFIIKAADRYHSSRDDHEGHEWQDDFADDDQDDRPGQFR